MKILFESKSGKQVLKQFKTISEAKSFVIKNKEVIKNAQIMEGPLGSGSLNPIQGLKQFKKGMDKKANYKKIDSVKDSFNKDIRMYILDILNDIGNKDNNFNLYGCGLDKHGWYIVGANVANGSMIADGPNIRRMDDDGMGRTVEFDSEKYKNKIYMPKLTKYLEKHHSLPSEKQLRTYIEGLIDTRYKQNFEKDRKKNPERHLSRTDVENF